MEFEEEIENIETENIKEKKKEILRYLRYSGLTLHNININEETFNSLSYFELYNLLGTLISQPPRNPPFRRIYSYIDNSSFDGILFVNNNPGQESKLIVSGGGIADWYYGQTPNGYFYEKVFGSHDNHSSIYPISDPHDPNKIGPR